MNFRKTTAKKNLVSLTPLIDVVFILLIFFMLVSRFSEWSHVDVNAPAPSTKSSNPMENSLLVKISEDGQLNVAGKYLQNEALVTLVENALIKNPDQLVLIKPHEKLPIQNVVDLLDLLSKTGLDNFSIIK